jgi:hypothetical protein
MRKLLLFISIFFTVNSFSEAGTVNIECVENTSQIQLFNDKNETSEILPRPAKGRYTYNYTVNTGKTIYIKMTLDGGVEYIKKPYVLKSGTDNNICMGLANIDGFYDTDRDQLKKVAEEVIKKLGRKEGKLKEIEAWLTKAIKDIQTNPVKN